MVFDARRRCSILPSGLQIVAFGHLFFRVLTAWLCRMARRASHLVILWFDEVRVDQRTLPYRGGMVRRLVQALRMAVRDLLGRQRVR